MPAPKRKPAKKPRRKPAKKKPMGRPPLITEEIPVDVGKEKPQTMPRWKAIVRAIRAGGHPTHAAPHCGIGYSTMRSWISRAEEWIEADRSELPKSELPYRDFLEAYEKARADAALTCITRIRQAGHWTADAWWLERSFPDLYGRRERIEHSGKIEGGGDSGPLDYSKLTDEQAEELERLLLLARRREQAEKKP